MGIFTNLNPYKTWNFRILLCLHLFTQFYLQNIIFFSLLFFSLKKKSLKICQHFNTKGKNFKRGKLYQLFRRTLYTIVTFFFSSCLISFKWKIHHLHTFVSTCFIFINKFNKIFCTSKPFFIWLDFKSVKE